VSGSWVYRLAAGPPGSCPLSEFLNFHSNTRWYAEHWLRRGAAHPQEHWVISERLDPWRRRVSEAEAGLREALLAEIRPEPPRAPGRPSPALTMPAEAPTEPAGERKPLPWHPSTPELSVTTACATCTAPFLAQRSTARFCSTRCRMVAHRGLAAAQACSAATPAG
jgi:hypothetical protein